MQLDLKDLEETVLKELDRWKVPGLELAIVKDGEVVVAGGYGRRDLARNLPVTPHTLFNHGSTGKAFTAFLIGTLVDDGLLDWDGLVVDYLPDFRLSDPYITSKVTVRDLLTHRTGLPSHEFAWVANPSLPRAELVRRIRYLELNRDLRQQWQYSNLSYTTAGHVAGTVTNSTWEDQMRERVFEPLGMKRTVTTVEEQRESKDAAVAYAERDEDVVAIDYRNMNNAAPAGQVISCATDISRWLLCHADGGVVEGNRIISEATLKELHTLQMSTGALLRDIPPFTHLGFYGYGLGWLVGIYRGQEWIWHNGGVDGFRTEMTIFPKARLGVALSANLHETQFAFAMLNQVLDRLVGEEAENWPERIFDRLIEARSQAVDAHPEETTNGPGPSHLLPNYAGEYEHPGYGRVTVSVEGSNLRFRVGDLDMEAEHSNFDTWKTEYSIVQHTATASFVTDAEGVVSEVVIPFEPEVQAIRFQRRTE